MASCTLGIRAQGATLNEVKLFGSSVVASDAGTHLPPFRIRVLLSTETEEQKKRGRPGNEATFVWVCVSDGSGVSEFEYLQKVEWKMMTYLIAFHLNAEVQISH